MESYPHLPHDSEIDRSVRQIADALRGLRFGTLTLVVQDGVVVQIERLEKQRIVRPARSNDRRRTG